MITASELIDAQRRLNEAGSVWETAALGPLLDACWRAVKREKAEAWARWAVTHWRAGALPVMPEDAW